MSDITASERRLSAALDRLDLLMEAAVRPPAEDGGQVAELTRQLTELQSENARLEQVLAQAQSGDAGSPDELQSRLEAATEQSARLATANEELTTANRNLLEAHATGGLSEDEVRGALEAEIQALRAARAAEMAQMSEIMSELERLLAEDEPSPDPDAGTPAELRGDAAGLPEAEAAEDMPEPETATAGRNEGI
ncbi:hypothetical protein [Paracoccus sp. (in: a-proteobacteria)]|uniref:hypothetical protein n=1 Tax=Paracoccus sp. TaxID=267 RepID=UPI00396C8E00